MRGSTKFRIPTSEPESAAAPRACDHPGCQGEGAFRAPKSRHRLNDYYWFCLEHVRDYNKSWNYCAGMSDLEVERMIRFDTVWQRPTWPLGSWGLHEDRLRAHIYRQHGLGQDEAQSGGDSATAERRRPVLTEEAQALAHLELDPPVDFATIKARYRALVKRHHPDANQGSREAEERLKVINHAYSVLRARFAG